MTFEHDEEDFIELRAALDNRIKNIPEIIDGVTRRGEIQKAENELKDAEDTIRSMDFNMRNVGMSATMQKKLKEYQSECARMKASLRKAEISFSKADRDELLSGGRDDILMTSLDQRERLLKTTDKLNKTSMVLEDTIAQAEDTVNIGIDTMERLDQQTRQMRRMKETTEGITEQLGKAKRLIRIMARRAITNKVIISIIILVLLGAVVMIVYFKWIKK